MMKYGITALGLFKNNKDRISYFDIRHSLFDIRYSLFPKGNGGTRRLGGDKPHKR